MINQFEKGIKVARFLLSITVPAMSKKIFNIAASSIPSLAKVLSILILASFLHACGSGQTVGLMTNRGIVNEFSMDGATINFSERSPESRRTDPSTEVRGTLFGMIISGEISLALTDGIHTYALAFFRNCQLVVPPADQPGPGKFIVRSGTYFVRGFTEETVQSPRGTIPLLRLLYLEKIK